MSDTPDTAPDPYGGLRAQLDWLSMNDRPTYFRMVREAHYIVAHMDRLLETVDLASLREELAQGQAEFLDAEIQEFLRDCDRLDG